MKRTIAWLCVLALTLSCFCGVAPVAAAAEGEAQLRTLTYYVSLSGKGGNNGFSEDKPLPGLDAVPWNELKAGDRVLLKAGETFPGTIRMVGVQGTPERPVTIGTYGTGAAPVIDARGQGIWLPETGNGNGGEPGKYVSSGITLYDCAYITVEGLTIKNVPNAMKSDYLCLDGTTNYQSADSARLTYSGVGVAADDVGASEGIVLSNITVQLGKELPNPTVAVKTDTSTTISTTGVTTGEALDPYSFPAATSGTYYVSTLNGSDSNDGSSPDKAFYSLHKINDLNLGAGAKVYLENGSVFENQYLHPEGGGSAEAPIIIDAYGASNLPKPQINTNGNGVWYQNYRKNLDNTGHLTHGWVSSSILLYDVPYIEIMNIAVTNFGRYGETPGADFENLGTYDGGTVPGETGYNGTGRDGEGNKIGCYQWGGKMCRTGVAGVAQDKGTITHTVLRNLDIENVYGQIVYKHMNNGGIYFTVARPKNEDSTGIARFDDVVIEGCYLKHVSRWGIAVAHTSYWREISPNGQKTVPDAACQKYGATNVYVGHNFLDQVGGDPITLMHAYEPFVEYNVSQNGGREMGNSSTAPRYMNNSSYNGYKGDVSAGIWPWKCKTALFEHNECYTMLYSHLGGNNDAQPWDADSGDSTIYQYNYSSGNTGACIMFCGGDAYNTVFRYNISYKDGVPWNLSNPQNGDNRRGILDPSGSPNGQIYNNTFVVAEGTPVYHYTSGSPHKVENNIFYNLGNTYAPQGGWDEATGLKFVKNIYVGFAQTGAGSYTAKDTDPITLTKNDPLFAGDVSTAPTAPADTSKKGARMVNGVRDWTHDWDSAFNMFKLHEDADDAINTGLEHNYDCLTQDADFGVPRVANEKDFYGNSLDEVHDIGAYDSQTTSPAVPSSACALVESLYEVRNTSELQVPLGTNLSPTVETFLKGLTVSAKATVKVYQSNGTTEVADGDKVAEDMKVKIVAENGTDNTVYTIKGKTGYNSHTDWVSAQQGNVWFYQSEDHGAFSNNTYGSQYDSWGNGYAVIEQNQAVGDISNSIGSGFTFRAPVSGKVTISFNYHEGKGTAATGTNQIRKRAATPNSKWQTYLRTFHNGVEDADKAVLIPMDSTTPIAVESYTITVAQGDTLSFMIRNDPKETSSTDNGGNHGVYFNPVITYLDETFTEPADRKAPTTPAGLRAAEVTDTAATLTWEASTDNVGVTGYKVQVGSDAEVTVTKTTKALTGLAANTEYTVTVKAVDAANNESAAATVTFTTAKTPDTERPSGVTGGQVVSATATTATLSWAAATDDVGVDHYEITVNDETVEVRNALQATLTGLAANREYTASIVAVDAAGNKSETPHTVTFTTAAAAVTADFPANVAVQRLGGTSAEMIWDPAGEDSAVVGYKVKLGLNGEEIDIGNRVRYTFTGLERFTEYTAYVCSYTVESESDWKSVTFTTLGSSENSLLTSVYEIRENSKLQVPYTEKNPLSLADFKAGLTVSDDAEVKVYEADGTTPVTSGDVAEGMQVIIVAQDGTPNNTTYTIVNKNTYNSFEDWVGCPNQGNVWFYQYEDANGNIVNHTVTNDWGWDGVGGAYKSVQRSQACGSVTSENGSGYTFRAPTSGMVQIRFFCYEGDDATTHTEDAVRKRANTSGNSLTPYIRVYANGTMLDGKSIPLPKDGSVKAVESMTFSVAKGDTLSFLARNEGSFTSSAGNNGVYFSPVIVYLNEEYVPDPQSVTLSETEATLYTNADPAHDMPGTLDLTATVAPGAAPQTVTWESTNPQFATVDQNGCVTAVADGTTAIIAKATATTGLEYTASCTVRVTTKITGLTVKNGDAVVADGATIKLYTNEGLADYPHAVTLTAEVEPSSAGNKMLSWTRPEGASGKLTIVRASDGLSATLTATTNELNVDEVTVTVASEADPTVSQTIKVQVIRKLQNPVSISGDAKVGKTLTADLNRLSMKETAKQALRFQWKRDGAAISGATGRTYVLTVDDYGKTISVDVTADPATFYEGTVSAAMTETVGKEAGPAAPTGLAATDCTVEADNDGTITGLDENVQYEMKKDDGEWELVDAGTAQLTGLTPGDYQIRIAATDTREAGDAVTLTVIGYGETAYTITVEAEHGTVACGTKATEGKTITLTVDPDEGYQLAEDGLSVTYVDAQGETQNVAVSDGKFVMPAGNVTVTATFEKLTFHLNHSLEHIDCDMEESHHEVEYGDTPEIHLTAQTGYTMPNDGVEVVRADGTLFTGYRYIHTVDSPDTAIIHFEQGITEDLTIRGKAVAKTLTVNYTVDGGVTAPEANAPRTVAYGAAYTGTLVASEGYRLPLGITVTMGGASFTDFDYTDGVITIAEGKITGNLVIKATGISASVDVVPVTGVELNRSNATLDKGSTLTLEATVKPANATDKSVIWESSDPAVASVDENGMVTGVSVGEATITVTTTDGHRKATCKVKVQEPVVNPDPPGPSGPSGPSAPSTPPAKTDVRENEDGTTTTVVTDRDGTVTETTEKLDGSTEVVETKPDGTVTETTTDPEGAKVEKVTTPDEAVTITATDKDGEEVARVEIPATLPTPEWRFDDVPKTHWADKEIHHAAALEVVKGVGGNKFDPSVTMDRASLATVLYRLSNGKSDVQSAFADVESDQWYAEAVTWAAKAEVVKGISDTEFAPKQLITREQLATMLCRYAKLLGLDTKVSGEHLWNFSDGVNTSAWAQDGVAWCVAKGILQGKGGSRLDPTADVSRAEVAVMLERFLGLLKK